MTKLFVLAVLAVIGSVAAEPYYYTTGYGGPIAYAQAWPPTSAAYVTAPAAYPAVPAVPLPYTAAYSGYASSVVQEVPVSYVAAPPAAYTAAGYPGAAFYPGYAAAAELSYYRR